MASRHLKMRNKSMARKKGDAGHEETEKVLSDIEKKISKEYRQAEKEVAEKLDKYMEAFQRKDEAKRNQLKAGKITQAEYDQWRVGQIAMGDRWEQLRQNLATDFTNADQIARSIASGHMPEVYAINMNYGTYQIEHDTKINTNFTLYDRQTVERLADDSNDIIPVPGKKISKLINEGKAQRWNNQQIQSVMMQSILQGESIPKIAKRLAKEVGEKDKRASIRNARTLTTGVQNAGRVDSYKRAEKMGIPLKQQWVATLDGRTRHEHRILDGQTAPVGGKFEVEGYKIAYPGDPTAPGHLIYNCRCTLIAATEGFEKDLSDLSLRRSDKLGDMTYEEWKNSKPVSTPKKSSGKKKTSTKASTTASTSTSPATPKGYKAGADPEYNKFKAKKVENDITRKAKDAGIDRVEVHKLAGELNTGQIIDKVGVYDREGACSSLALAYASNKAGLDVTDFRDKASRDFFTDNDVIVGISNLKGVKKWEATGKDDFVCAQELLGNVEKGKEYLLSTGEHVAAVRMWGGQLEYLEIQGEPEENEFIPFIDDGVTMKDTLKYRFLCKSNKGKRTEQVNLLIDIDSLKDNDEFRACMEYLNNPGR